MKIGFMKGVGEVAVEETVEEAELDVAREESGHEGKTWWWWCLIIR